MENVNLTVKYCSISLDYIKTNYENIQIPDHIEYLEIKAFDTDIVLWKILNKIHIPPGIKGLCLIVMHRMESDWHTRENEKYYSPIVKEEISVNLLSILNEFIPSTIEYLKANFKFCNRPWNSNSKSLDKFNKLRCLVIDDSNIDYLLHITTCDSQLDDLPGTLERLHINYPYFTQPLNNLPPNLKVLTFNNNDYYSEKYVHLMDNLPTGLEVLVFPKPYNIGSYQIYYGDDCNGSDDGDDGDDGNGGNNFKSNDLLSYLPASLKYLSIPWLSEEISLDNLPNSLEYLEINNNIYLRFYSYYLSLSRIPESLHTINIYGEYDKDSVNIVKQKFPYLDIL